MGGTEDADPEGPCEEGDIGDEDDRVRGITMLPCWCVVNTVPYPVLALPVFLRQLTDCLPLVDVFLPKSMF